MIIWSPSTCSNLGCVSTFAIQSWSRTIVRAEIACNPLVLREAVHTCVTSKTLSQKCNLSQAAELLQVQAEAALRKSSAASSGQGAGSRAGSMEVSFDWRGITEHFLVS